MDKRRLTGKDLQRFFEFSRSRFGEARPETKPMARPKNAAFEMARRPDQLRPPVPVRDVAAADAAIREIKSLSSAARDAYRQARLSSKDGSARDYVRQALALGLTTFEGSKLQMVEQRIRGEAGGLTTLLGDSEVETLAPRRRSLLARLFGRKSR